MSRSLVGSVVVALAAALASRADAVVISQAYGGGGNSGAPLARDFVELFNPTADAIAVDGWSVQYATANGSSWQVTPLTGSIAAGGYFLVAQARGSGSGAELPPPDVDGEIAMSSVSGKVALVGSLEALAGACPTAPDVVALFGYGSANCFQGAGAAPALSNSTAALRRGAGCFDSGNDADDFVAASPAPRSAATASVVCDPSPPTATVTMAATLPAPPTATPSATLHVPPSPTVTLQPAPSASATPTAVATVTASPTATWTRVPTSFATATPRASATVEPHCGNGRVDVDEHCDDGNRTSGDVCPSDAAAGCRYTAPGLLVHGHPRLRRVRERGCWLGWYVVGGGGFDSRRGLPLPHQRCDDQDPRCDFDPQPGRCEMHVVACLNVASPDLPDCSPAGVEMLRVAAPHGGTRSMTSRANRLALVEGLAALLDPRTPQSGYVHGLPLAADEQAYCSAPIPIVIERGPLLRRSETLRVRGRAGDVRGTRLDSRLRLTCLR